MTKRGGKSEAADWEAIRLAYVTNTAATYDTVAQSFGVTKSSVGRRAIKERWQDERDRYQAEIQRLVREESARLVAKTASEQMLEMLADVARVRRKIIATLEAGGLVDLDETETVMDTDDCGAPVKRVRRSVRLDVDTRNLGAVLSTERGLLRDILGLDSGGINGPGYDPDDSFV